MKRYVFNLAVALDCLANAILCARQPGQTISSRAWEAHLKGKAWSRWAVPAINTVMGNKDHCRLAYEAELAIARVLFEGARA